MHILYSKHTQSHHRVIQVAILTDNKISQVSLRWDACAYTVNAFKNICVVGEVVLTVLLAKNPQTSLSTEKFVVLF